MVHLLRNNAPFKNKMCELLENTIIIGWDPLHLINRAHIEARGKLINDIEEIDDEKESMEQEPYESVLKELIGYIQKESKK